MTGFALLLAALAASCNAAGDLLQRASARSESSGLRRSVTLFGHLVRQRRWLAGVVVSLVGLCVHIGALSLGELATVQPVLVAELPLAVLGSAYFFGRRLARRDWFAVAALAGGLALFVGFLAPGGGDRLGVDGGVWTFGLVVVAVVVGLLTVAGWRAEHDLRAGLLAAAAGVGYGLTGVLFAVAGRTLDTAGPAAAATAWQTYAALVTGLGSFYLLQNALAAGAIVAVEPGLTLANPLVAVTWGMVVFGETARAGAALVGTVAGGALLVTGVVVLARSPVLTGGVRSRARPHREARTGPGSAAGGAGGSGGSPAGSGAPRCR